MNEERIFTPDDVARRLQVARLTVVRWLRAGKLRGIKTGKIWRVQQQDLDAFIRDHLQGAPIVHAAKEGL
jgi:excisionase family DNA binding protein